MWCHIRDKKFKFYKDGPEKCQLAGTDCDTVFVFDAQTNHDF